MRFRITLFLSAVSLLAVAGFGQGQKPVVKSAPTPKPAATPVKAAPTADNIVKLNGGVDPRLISSTGITYKDYTAGRFKVMLPELASKYTAANAPAPGVTTGTYTWTFSDGGLVQIFFNLFDETKLERPADPQDLLYTIAGEALDSAKNTGWDYESSADTTLGTLSGKIFKFSTRQGDLLTDIVLTRKDRTYLIALSTKDPAKMASLEKALRSFTLLN